jgi:tetrahydromethanopterin S-methyltransferase subunit D
VAIICGLLAAFSVHAVKATGRPLITATTAGVGNPIVSTAEDVAAGVTTLVAILVPALAATLIVALVAFLAWRLLRRRQRRLVAQA